MPFSSNFIRVSVGKDDNGHDAILIDGKTTDPADVKAIYAAVAHGKDLVAPSSGGTAGADASVRLKPKGGQIQSAGASKAPSATDWNVTLPQTRPKLKVGERVVVLGVAMLKSTKAPAFWQQTLTTLSVEDRRR